MELTFTKLFPVIYCITPGKYADIDSVYFPLINCNIQQRIFAKWQASDKFILQRYTFWDHKININQKFRSRITGRCEELRQKKNRARIK